MGRERTCIPGRGFREQGCEPHLIEKIQPVVACSAISAEPYVDALRQHGSYGSDAARQLQIRRRAMPNTAAMLREGCDLVWIHVHGVHSYQRRPYQPDAVQTF